MGSNKMMKSVETINDEEIQVIFLSHVSFTTSFWVNKNGFKYRVEVNDDDFWVSGEN